ncbi:MAG TPA: hypothetical protein VK772_01670 [Puia sp.]|nr:hypothetical protein [Puia sp.]
MNFLKKPLFQFVMIAILIIAAHGLGRRSAKTSQVHNFKHTISVKE